MMLLETGRRILVKIYALRKKRQQRVLFFACINTLLGAARFAIRLMIKTAHTILPPSLKTGLFPIAKKLFRHPPQARRYLKRNLDIDSFFKALNDRNINYVVLRWFENLPHIDAGEDLDILIADDDIDRISDLISDINNGNNAIDLYSVSGIDGASYNSVPYYPPHLAASILASRQYHKNLYAIPDERRHFLSLAYHAVFHKGQNSGLAFPPEKPSMMTDHDYRHVLENLAAKTGIKCDIINFVTLFDLLKKEEWMPALDTFRILARKDVWLQKLLTSQTETPNTEPDGIMVFVVREWALEHGKLDFIAARMRDAMLDVIKIHVLDDKEKIAAQTYIRGGKWDRGPYPVSGGAPAAIIIAYDYTPEKPAAATLAKYPFMSNEHSTIKHAIRDDLNAEMPLWRHTNCLHSADDAAEAWRYIEIAIPDQAQNLRKEINKRQAVFAATHPVLEIYKANGTRAKTEKIDYNGQPAVKKTFKIGCERFAEREAFAYKTFSQIIETVPPLLECGSNHIIIPWYDNILPDLTARQKRSAIKKHADCILRTVRCFYDNGYAIIGFYPGNLIITSSDKLKVIDFEFLYSYSVKPSSFISSFDLAGVPLDFDGDLPRGSKGRSHTFENTWRDYIELKKLQQFN